MTHSETNTNIQPSIKPAVIQIFLTIGISLVLTIGLILFKTDIGERAANILIAIVVLVGFIVIIRAAVEIFLLTRTKYIITDEQLRREFHMFYRTRVREIPIDQLRGIELNKGLLQAILGYGDLRFLTGGTNQSLGFLKFERIPDPKTHRNKLREMMDVEHYDAE